MAGLTCPVVECGYADTYKAMRVRVVVVVITITAVVCEEKDGQLIGGMYSDSCLWWGG